MKNILVVDDSLTFRLYLKKCLSMLITEETLQITEVKDGRVALGMTETNSFDLIFSDVNMPVMTGEELLRAVRSSAEHADLPFIFVTSLANETKTAGLMELGATAVLRKPLDPQELATVLAKLRITSTEEKANGYG